MYLILSIFVFGIAKLIIYIGLCVFNPFHICAGIARLIIYIGLCVFNPFHICAWNC